MSIGIVHPGDMGASIALAAKLAGAEVQWASESRSDATRERAQTNQLKDLVSLEALVEESATILSICPPHAAIEVAAKVMELGFKGAYVDGNAVAPSTMDKIAKITADHNVQLIDGGIIGPAAVRPGTTRFYLSGEGADHIAALFDGSVVDARVIPGSIGAASALKLCYAANTKGTQALIAVIRAAASHYGVEHALKDEWNISQAGLAKRSDQSAGMIASRAWRFAGEMREIAKTFEEAHLPGGFHNAAAETYDRLSQFKDDPTTPVSAIIQALLADNHHRTDNMD